MFLVNSCLGLFSAAHSREHPLFRSYGVNLPSSLTTLLPLALESSSYLPVSVCGTGTLDIHTAFLASLPAGLRYYISLDHYQNQHLAPTFKKCPCAEIFRWGRNLYRLCIGYAFRPDLSSRLTWSGRTFLQKPEVSGHVDSPHIRATHSGILTSVNSTAAYATVSPLTQRSPTPHLRAA